MNLPTTEHEKLLEATWDSVQDIILLTNVDSKITYVNQAGIRKFGYTPDELLGKPLKFIHAPKGKCKLASDFINPDSSETAHDKSKQICLQTKDGTFFLGHFTPNTLNIGSEPLTLNTITDVTQHRSFVEQEKQQQSYLERIEHLAKIGSWRIDIETGRLKWSKGILNITGKDPNTYKLDFEKSLEVVHEEDRQEFKEQILALQKTGIPFRHECRIYRENGEIGYVALEGDAEIDPITSKPKTVFGSLVDITEHRKKESELVRAKNLLRAAINSMPGRVFWKDIEFNYLGCNQAFANDAGLDSPTEIVGKTDFEIFGETSARAFRTDDANVIRSGSSKKFFEEPQERYDGTTAWLQTSKVPLKDQGGNTVGVLGTYDDITELKEKERRHALTHYSVDQIKSAIFWCNPDGSFFYVNKTACDWLQYSFDELMSMHVADINPEFPKEKWDDHYADIKKEKAVRMESVHQRKNGEVYPVELYSNYVIIDNLEFNISFVFDITERRLAEEKIKEYQYNLEALVEDRTKALREINNELETFAYSVSHDLRAPLRGIDGFSQALVEDYANKLDDTGVHYLNRIRAGSQKMSSLIDDILKMSRIARMEHQSTEVDLSEITTSILSELQDNEPDRSIQISVTPDFIVQADKKLISIVFDNLLSNAWKYSSKNPSASINVTMKHEHSADIICIEDNGDGFEMEYIDKLFTPFQRLHSQGEFEGNGIGLATVKRIIQKHEGSISAYGEKGKGAKFSITLPISNPSQKNE